MPIFSTDLAAAIEPKNKHNSSDIPKLKQIESIDNIASPEPILSTIFDANAGRKFFKDLFFKENKYAPSEPQVITSF